MPTRDATSTHKQTSAMVQGFLTPAQYAQARRKAATAGVSLSAWARARLRAWCQHTITHPGPRQPPARGPRHVTFLVPCDLDGLVALAATSAQLRAYHVVTLALLSGINADE